MKKTIKTNATVAGFVNDDAINNDVKPIRVGYFNEKVSWFKPLIQKYNNIGRTA